MQSQESNKNEIQTDRELQPQDIRSIVVGLDIGTTKVVAIVGRKNQYGKIEVLGYGKASNDGVKVGEVFNLKKTEEAIRKAIAKAEYHSKIKIQKVIVGIAGKHIRSLQTREHLTRNNPEEIITQKDIDLLTEQVKKLHVESGEQIIHALPQEFKVDDISDIDSPPIGMAGTRLEANFHVVVGKMTAIKNLIRCVNMAGLEVEDITLEPLASAKSVLMDEEKEGGIVLVDMGGGTTDIAIFENHIIRHTAIIPAGGNIITKDLQLGIKILLGDAEMLKKEYGSAYPGLNSESDIVVIEGLPGHKPVEVSMKTISRIIKARLEEIINHIDLEIHKYLDIHHENMLLGGIVLTGGGAQMKHLVQLVNLLTGKPTRLGYPDRYLAAGTDKHLKSPVFSTAIGLLMQGLENKVNYEELEYEELSIEKEKSSIDDEIKEKPDEIEKKIPSKSIVDEKRKNTMFDWIMRLLNKFE